jgi:hypothetical protein
VFILLVEGGKCGPSDVVPNTEPAKKSVFRSGNQSSSIRFRSTSVLYLVDFGTPTISAYRESRGDMKLQDGLSPIHLSSDLLRQTNQLYVYDL